MPRDINSKMDRMVVKNGVPIASEGVEGDMTVRSTPEGIRLYVKFKNKWYGITLESEGIEVEF